MNDNKQSGVETDQEQTPHFQEHCRVQLVNNQPNILAKQNDTMPIPKGFCFPLFGAITNLPLLLGRTSIDGRAFVSLCLCVSLPPTAYTVYVRIKRLILRITTLSW